MVTGKILRGGLGIFCQVQSIATGLKRPSKSRGAFRVSELLSTLREVARVDRLEFWSCKATRKRAVLVQGDVE